MAGMQGLQPINHFQVLQLDESAPQALVVEAYRALSRRATSRETSTGRLTGALYTAYAAAMACSAPSSCADPEEAASHYSALHLDRHADTDLVRLAYEFLQRTSPLPEHSLARHLREEAFRVLTNPQLRARYDQEPEADTLRGVTRPMLHDVVQASQAPRKERPVASDKRGFLGFGRGRPPEFDARDRRLLTLRAQLPLGPADLPSQADEPPRQSQTVPVAEAVFTAGPRSGLRVELDGNVLPLGEGKATATLWRHGDRFLLRHSGKQVRVGGAIPALSIVVLEDDDEIAVGNDRLRFFLNPSRPS